MAIPDLYIETDRLILRPPSAADFDGWAAFSADAQSNRFLGGPKSRAEAWRFLCAMAGAWHIRGFAMFSVLLKENGAWIGRIGPWQPEGWPGTEVGWGILREYEGKGYALEAAVASIDYAFDTHGWDKVIHTIDPENIASIRLAERLGSVNCGPTKLPEPYVDAHVDSYEQSRAQWQENRKQFV